MTADLLALLDSDPPAGILAVADLREQRAKAVRPELWAADEDSGHSLRDVVRAGRIVVADVINYGAGDGARHAEHIAAEANPSHSLAAVRRWRGVVKRHQGMQGTSRSYCANCTMAEGFPCSDLRETADEARSYLGGGS